MSRALQCPVCGHKHPVEDLPDAETFDCDECGRILKVPQRTRSASSSGRPPVAAGGAAGATILPDRRSARGSADQPGRPESLVDSDRTRGTDDASILDDDGPLRSPVAVRIVAWVIALPLSAVVVFGVANATGLLTGSQLTDMFLEARPAAYGRLIALLPLWAVTAAGVVHLVDALWKGSVKRRRRKAAQPDPVDEESDSDTVLSAP